MWSNQFLGVAQSTCSVPPQRKLHIFLVRSTRSMQKEKCTEMKCYHNVKSKAHLICPELEIDGFD